jgi:GTP diphosphokinase / guanosine-3',5'-bis(diphosphate) 3'-diphosphatase
MNNEQINIEPFYELPLETDNPYGKNILEDLYLLLSNCNKYIANPDLNKIADAYYFCISSHKNLKRGSGEPYHTHPYKVALSVLKDFSLKDTSSVIAALLHDVVEDVEGITNDTIEKIFGNEVAQIVDGVTKISGTMTRQMDKAATYGKLFLALVKDVRVIMIKLADRLDNMKTLAYLPEKKQKSIAHETLNFYTPFAQRLGLTNIKKKFEDLSLYFIDKKVFNSIHEALEEKRKIFINYIRNFIVMINQRLNERNIAHVVTIEHKHVYEIFTMIENGRSLNDIDNFYSLVITLKTNDYSEAYRAYGIIANLFGPVSSMDDFIARPKINLYRALHSMHFGPGRKLIEIIIRTEEMDKIVEKGITGISSTSKITKPLSFEEDEVVDLTTWMQDIISSGESYAIQKIWGTIKRNLYEDYITVHHRGGKSYNLPKGSCPIDLAFAVSDEVAYHCISVKVNDEIKSLDYEINNNDRVEIITTPNATPNPEWQNHVITSKAVVKLYNYFKNNDFPQDEFNFQTKNIFKLKIIAEERKGLLNDIKSEIGQENIIRVFLYSFNSEFEGLFYIKSDNKHSNNLLFTKLLTIKGIKGIEKIDSD